MSTIMHVQLWSVCISLPLFSEGVDFLRVVESTVVFGVRDFLFLWGGLCATFFEPPLHTLFVSVSVCCTNLGCGRAVPCGTMSCP